jgi:hypothetical protein
VSDLSDRLRAWDLGARRLAEQAEACVAEADALVRALHRAGRLRPAVILGAVMGVRPYDPGQGSEDSGQVVQAVLLVPEGVGVLFWDTEDLHLIPHGPDRDREARQLFTPLANLRPLMRVQLLPYAAELLARLFEAARGR